MKISASATIGAELGGDDASYLPSRPRPEAQLKLRRRQADAEMG